MTIKETIKQEIDKLPDDILSEVYDFILYLETKRDTNILKKQAQELSLSTFAKVWDNDMDSIYDN
ncbi:hypothetical protein MCHI_001514 [Candidatus Magnetoovum chiemensis]|nr:hypothetical protein MCHI_001514 [Candidatus Magnetoovum chiemensis]